MKKISYRGGMMDLDDLRRLAAKEELSLNYLAKDEQISKILQQLQDSNEIILKGGTAVNRVYLRNKRFSEDIDLDLIFLGTVKSAIPITKEIVSKLQGVTVEQPRQMKNTIRYDVYYTNPLNHKDKIQIEFTVIHTPEKHSKKIVNFGFVPAESALLNVYEIEIIIRHKIDRVLNRIEGKDYYDLFYLLELTHKPIKLTKHEKKRLKERMGMDERQIKSVANVLNHYLPKTKRENWYLFMENLKNKIEEKL